MKTTVSEAEHPLLCEGTRREKGDLALALMITYKDDQSKLKKARNILVIFSILVLTFRWYYVTLFRSFKCFVQIKIDRLNQLTAPHKQVCFIYKESDLK